MASTVAALVPVCRIVLIFYGLYSFVIKLLIKLVSVLVLPYS
jgi:hypothetical protein